MPFASIVKAVLPEVSKEKEYASRKKIGRKRRLRGKTPKSLKHRRRIKEKIQTIYFNL